MNAASCPAGERRDRRMPDNVALFATIILLLPMIYFPAGGAGLSAREAGHPGCRPAVARHVQWLFPDGGHCWCHRDASRCRDWSPGFGHWHLLDRGFRGFVAPLVFAADGCPAE